MSFLQDSFFNALKIIASFDPELYQIILLSLTVSGIAIVISSILALSLVFLLELYTFRGKRAFLAILNTLMGLPPVVVGLALYLFLSRSGPLGYLELLYTPAAMVIAQIILATPIIAGLSYATLVTADDSIRFAARSLGATNTQATIKTIQDIRYGIFAAVMAGFGRVSAEVGAVLIVGGNISGFTRVMTTAIALEADKGDFEIAIALGIILLMISFFVNGSLMLLRKND